MTNNLIAMNSDNVDHIMSYAIGPEFEAWNHIRHNPRLSQCFDLGRRLTRTRQDFYSHDGDHVVNWIPRRIQRIVYTIHGYRLSCSTTRAHSVSEFVSLLYTRWYNLRTNTPINISVPERHRFTMYFATLGDSDHAIQRCGINVSTALHHMPIGIAPEDEEGNEWSAHYDDYGRPCPSGWPHGRHWRWAPYNMATTYSIHMSKRQTYRIRQLVAQDEWDNQSENRMIVELVDHSNDTTYILLAGDAIFSPPHPTMRDSQHNNHPPVHRSPVIHTTLARSGYTWPRWPRLRDDRHFADIFITFPGHDPGDTPPQSLLQALQAFTTQPYVDAEDSAHDTDLHTDILDNPTRITPWPTNRTNRLVEIMVQIGPLETFPDRIHGLLQPWD